MYVPEKYYVGFQSQGDDSLVGFFTPDDGDDKSKNRKATVDAWSHTKFKNKSITITNEPHSGFRIVDTARRYHNNNVLFRVIHPEVGAEFEITAENLNVLHQQCIIEYGEIKTELLFVRNGQNNILVVKDSEEHKQAIHDMEVDKAKKEAIASINKKDIVVGSMIDIPQCGTVIFLGKHTVSYITKIVNNDYYSSLRDYDSSYHVISPDEKYLVFLDTKRNYWILRKSWPKLEKVHAEKYDDLDIDTELKKAHRVYTGAYNSEAVKYMALDEVLNPDDFEITFEESKTCKMNNMDNWGYDSYTYGLLPDGSFYLAYPRNYHTKNGYKLGIKYDMTYKAQGLSVIPQSNKNCFHNLNSEIEVTDPNTVFYKIRITKKKDKK